MTRPLERGDALLLVDVQQDFCPGGSLPVGRGDEIIPLLNEWIALARSRGIPIIASRDWHTAGHASFQERGGPWPSHCIQGTPGARFHPGLRLPEDALVISKGVDPEREGYSAFDGTPLADRLHEAGVRRLLVGGLALDYCVERTIRDALASGFEVDLLREATRPIDVQPGDGERALAELRSAGVRIVERSPWIDDENVALFTDLYELAMLQSYYDQGMRETAVFELFFRHLPRNRNYLVACGLDDALRYLERLNFSPQALAYLDSLGSFSNPFLESLREFRFTGDVYAVPEGTPVFPNEPLLQVEAPIPQAQLVECFLMNQIHFQTLAASKAARILTAAAGRRVVDYGLRRMHGTDAGLKGARAFYIGGIDSTSNVLAGRLYGIPLSGTMAHSYIQAVGNEREAFARFVQSWPQSTLLVDTYDTLEGVKNVIRLAEELGAAFHVRAIRLDSGDLGRLAREGRRLLDQAGLTSVEIVASGNLDEESIAALVNEAAPITGFGVGSRLGVSQDAPSLDMAYKLSSYAGEGRIKLSPQKSTLPSRKEIYRRTREGPAEGDVLALPGEAVAGRPLLVQVMRQGVRTTAGRSTLREARERCRSLLLELPERVRRLPPAEPPYPVELSPGLAALTEGLKQSLAGPRARGAGLGEAR